MQEIHAGIADYLAIGGMLDAGLTGQPEMGLASFRRATGRVLTGGELVRDFRR